MKIALSLWSWLHAHQQAVSWSLVVIGWFLSSFLGYSLASLRSSRDRAEKVFEELSVLIEQGEDCLRRLEFSFDEKQPPESRLALWAAYDSLGQTYRANRSRHQFLLQKYFGTRIASKLEFILDGLYGYGSDLRESSESANQVTRTYVPYIDVWLGASPNEETTGEWNGYKWQMMKKCGLDVRSFLSQIDKHKKDWLNNSIKGSSQ